MDFNSMEDLDLFQFCKESLNSALLGDLVFRDLDSVVIVPWRIEAKVLRRAHETLQGEGLVREAILSGMTTVEVYKKYKIM